MNQLEWWLSTSRGGVQERRLQPKYLWHFVQDDAPSANDHNTLHSLFLDSKEENGPVSPTRKRRKRSIDKSRNLAYNPLCSRRIEQIRWRQLKFAVHRCKTLCDMRSKNDEIIGKLFALHTHPGVDLSCSQDAIHSTFLKMIQYNMPD
jgi:hypothetical protein